MDGADALQAARTVHLAGCVDHGAGRIAVAAGRRLRVGARRHGGVPRRPQPCRRSRGMRRTSCSSSQSPLPDGASAYEPGEALDDLRWRPGHVRCPKELRCPFARTNRDRRSRPRRWPAICACWSASGLGDSDQEVVLDHIVERDGEFVLPGRRCGRAPGLLWSGRQAVVLGGAIIACSTPPGCSGGRR